MIVTVGSICLDTTRTPFKTAEEVLGGSGCYFSLASSFFAETGLIGVIGTDFPKAYRSTLEQRLNLRGLEVKEGRTFRFDSSFGYDLGVRTANKTELNVFGEWAPAVPDEYKDAEYLYLGNVGPDQQLRVLDQMRNPKLTVADTIEYWIVNQRDILVEVLSRVNGAVLNDEEVRHLCDTTNVITGARKIMDWGADFVIVKKGEHGATLFTEDIIFPTCSYPIEEISDPTGAGDSFAGGFMGHIARRGDLSMQTFKEAVIYGNIMGSYVVEKFSVEKLLVLTIDDIEKRYEEYREMVQF
jgi:sugar/nucleoside kinase (ribokinase family)